MLGCIEIGAGFDSVGAEPIDPATKAYASFEPLPDG